ncbi:ankyrin repeat domain-containing protein 13D [Rhipicephalus sanguineus]|uniref:ankyrin repeat domain-containing protein 13D n=1 Tax=Rhipicephalus sanguineus TaxID=34632 RepID=UPI001893E9BC|nr:ankyrin repeat domain-containing protein 13D [Rhipicephalus sanguineus]
MSDKLKAALQEEYPLHWLAWHNDYEALKALLEKSTENIEQRDCRGRTALMLAVTLGHLEVSKILLNHGANVNVENNDGYTVVHEAVSTGDPELLAEVLTQRDLQRYSTSVGGIPDLLKRIRDTPDFYVEMKWEFTSWVPLLSRMCPSDTYKVYKSGANVRIDTTLLGFDQSNWQRGRRSYIFKGQEDLALMMEVDHDSCQVHVEQMQVLPPEYVDLTGSLRPSQEAISARLTSPIVATYIDTDKISFERNKSGILGWKSDKSETINGHNCKVFSATNVELVTKTRVEHLSEADKARHKAARSPLQSFLGTVEVEEGAALETPNGDVTEWRGNPCHIRPEEYFNAKVDLGGRDIGRPREATVRTQKFRANLWLCEDYPLSLPQQILPIVDLMSINSNHFARLRDFITLQLPAGFPVKIEIPLFHVLNARITFGNINAFDEPVPGVTTMREQGTVMCKIDESCFEAPSSYARLGANKLRQFNVNNDEDDELLQYAIEQSFVEASGEENQVTVWEALTTDQTGIAPELEEDHALQRAIQESLASYQKSAGVADGGLTVGGVIQQQPQPQPQEQQQESNEWALGASGGTDLAMALRLSQQAKEEEDRRRREEDEMLERILQLSMTEK